MTDFIIIELQTTNTVLVSSPGPQGAAGPGVPLGGVADQGLVKQSATNFDTAWGIPGLNTVSSWNVQQYYPLSALVINGDDTIDWDWDTQPEAMLTVGKSGTHVLNIPSNRQPGIKTLRVYQTGVGDGVITFDAAYLLDSSISGFTFVPDSFIDLFFKDDGTYITAFGREYLV